MKIGDIKYLLADAIGPCTGDHNGKPGDEVEITFVSDNMVVVRDTTTGKKYSMQHKFLTDKTNANESEPIIGPVEDPPKHIEPASKADRKAGKKKSTGTRQAGMFD